MKVYLNIKFFFIVNFILLVTTNLSAEAIFTPPNFPEKEVIKYRTFKKSNTNNITILEKKLIRTNINGAVYYKIYTKSTEGFNRIELLDKNLFTIKFLQMRGKEVDRKLTREGDMIHLIMPPKDIDKYIKIKNEVYDAKSMQYLLRCFPWKKQKSIEFYSMLNNGRIVKLRAEKKGISEVKIPAGKFKAYKVLIEPASRIAKLVYRTKLYFYFSVKSPYPYLKYEDTDGGTDEVISIKTYYKGGTINEK